MGTINYYKSLQTGNKNKRYDITSHRFNFLQDQKPYLILL